MPSSSWIRIKGLTQLDDLRRWMGHFDEAARSPRVFKPIIRAWGYHNDWLFELNKAPNGRVWQGISEYTREKREERGYDPDGPILHQSWQLRNMATVPFMRWQVHQRQSSRQVNAPYGNHHALSMRSWISGNVFTATISGARVQNQYGKRLYGEREGTRGRTRQSLLPARPFWGIDMPRLRSHMSPLAPEVIAAWRRMPTGRLKVT